MIPGTASCRSKLAREKFAGPESACLRRQLLVEIAPRFELRARVDAAFDFDAARRGPHVAAMMGRDRGPPIARELDAEMFFERPADIRKAGGQIGRRVAERIGHERHGHHPGSQLVEITRQLGPTAATKERVRPDRIALIGAGDRPLQQPAATVRQLDGPAQVDQCGRVLAATVTAHAAPALERGPRRQKRPPARRRAPGSRTETSHRSRILARSEFRSARSLAMRTARSTKSAGVVATESKIPNF